MVSPGVPNMAMVNVNNFLNVKDSRWLQLEVCREFQRNKCTRPDTECKFAHPPPNVEVQNGRVTACYDSIKGRCNREKPPCKYFHPPQHLKDQLLINGRNHLALKNAIMTQIQGLSPGTPVVPGTIPVMQQQYYPSAPTAHSRQEQRSSGTQAQYTLYNTAISAENVPLMLSQHNSPYLAGIPTMGNFNPYIASSPVMTMGMTDVASPITGVVPQQVVTAQKVPRTDRLEVCREFQRGACKRPEQECRFAHPPDHVSTTDEGTVTVCMDAIKSRCSREPCRYFHPPPHLQAQLRASQGRAAQQPVPGAAVAAAAAAVPLAPPPPLPAAAAAAAAAAELGKKRGRDPSDELLMAFPGMGVPYKRPAGDKSGVPVYQPTGNAAYQQALMQQLGGQSFVPVSCEYGGSVTLAGVGGQADTQDTTAANNHAAASSAQPTPSSSSSSTSTTTTINSQTTGKAIFSSPPSGTTTTSTTSSTSSSSSVAGETAGASPAPLPPQQPVNVFSYTGYALSKGLRPQFKPPTSAPTIMGPTALATHGMVPPGLTAGHLPGLSYGGVAAAPLASMGVTPYVSTAQQLVVPGMTHSVAGMGLPAMSHGLGGMAAGMAPALGGVATASLGGLGGGMPLMSPSLMVPQYPASSILPQYTALSSNTNYSLAQGGEQPYKKLKTS
ncbi:muscleblind-like protein 1 isoform X3 [Penaeus vannamei]|uniref:muscleblind-like protein 1 isoform X3 n=1 Tax=Penaeus vannamei TaxID=6689 RepID=UPI00387F5D5A